MEVTCVTNLSPLTRVRGPPLCASSSEGRNGGARGVQEQIDLYRKRGQLSKVLFLDVVFDIFYAMLLRGRQQPTR